MKKITDRIYCDCCDECCTITDPVHEHEYATIDATWGYFSNQDGTYYEIELCENCFNEVIGLLKEKRRKIGKPIKSDALEGKSYFPL